MFLTGFADEASPSIDIQIAATKELGWKYIETRNINSKNLATLSDEEFEMVCEKMANAGLSFNCYGSAVANWQRHPRKEEDFIASKEELLAAIPRMQRLGIKMLRGMSFLTPTDEQPDSPELEAIIFAKVRELVQICANAGITYGHENCMNYGGLSYVHSLKLIEAVNSDNFKLIYDTGNPTFNYHNVGAKPYMLQSSWDFYRNVREFIAYVHIKDATALPLEDSVTRPKADFCYAGDGCGDIRAIIIDLKKTGYDGGFSMEPHLKHVFHDAEASDTANEQVNIDTYINYGKKFEKLLVECGWTL